MLRAHIASIVTTVVRDRLRELHNTVGWMLTFTELAVHEPAPDPTPSIPDPALSSPLADEQRDRAIYALEDAAEAIREYALYLTDPHASTILIAGFVPELDELRRRFMVGTCQLATPSADERA